MAWRDAGGLWRGCGRAQSPQETPLRYSATALASALLVVCSSCGSPLSREDALAIATDKLRSFCRAFPQKCVGLEGPRDADIFNALFAFKWRSSECADLTVAIDREGFGVFSSDCD